MIFKTFILLYRGKNLPIGRTSFRKLLTKGRSQKSPEILLPPYISISELRLMLNSDYVSCFRTGKVTISRNKYIWNDNHGRIFENVNKRNVIIPFENAAYLSKNFGFKPIKINPEPNINEVFINKDSIPVISVLGHNEHGKSTLIEKMIGQNLPGREHIVKTQHLIASTVAHSDDFCVTFLDTPGDFLFDVIRGRAIYLSDLAIVVVSVEGAELRTKDVILQADKFNVPVIFCVNKIDLDYCDVELVKSELMLECNLMYDSGLISRDFRKEIENIVPISALKGQNLEMLKETIKKNIPKKLPYNNIRMEHYGGDEVKKYEKYIRRSNCLVMSGIPPKGVGFILEIFKTQSFGIVLTVIVRGGTLVEGNYFVAGTTYGRISGIYPTKESISRNEKLDSVGVGRSVYITGIRDLDGTSIDDLVIILPQHEAFRLSQYRKQIQILKSSQISGPELETPWAVSLKTNESYYQIKENNKNTDEKDNKEKEEEEEEEMEIVEEEEEPEVEDRRNEEKQNKKQKIKIKENLDEHLESIYLKPVEQDDEWSTRCREHNERLNERWRNRIKLDPEIIRSNNKENKNKTNEEKENDDEEDEMELVEEMEIRQKNKKIKINNQMKLKINEKEIGKPVIPVILRANYLGTFDSLLDGFELLEKEYNVRIPLVHGGIGPIVPNDIVQAEIGNKFTFVPVYAFQVPIHTDAAKHAIINKIIVKSFNLYSDVLEDVRKRCIRTVERVSKINSAR